MKIKKLFPSIVFKDEILFVQVGDMLDGREYLDDRNIDRFVKGFAHLEKLTSRFSVIALGFEGLSYISSLAISQLIDYQERSVKNGYQILYYDLSPKVRIILEELGLSTYFHIYGSRKLILKFFRTS
tara:strand:+ start:157 stop:537 length:381 start_codon:yes stop_codon:yes gene_type:complete